MVEQAPAATVHRSRTRLAVQGLLSLVLVVATESGHNIQDEQPELVLDAIRDVVLAVRAGDPVPH